MGENNSMSEHSAPPPIQPPLMPGDPAPWFRTRSDINPEFNFASLGGRYIVLSFLGSFSRPDRVALYRALLDGVVGRFGDFTTALVLMTADGADAEMRVPEGMGGVRYLFDDAGAIAPLYGADYGQTPVSFILDERLRVFAVVKEADAARHTRALYHIFDRLPPLPVEKGAERQAPVLIVPRVFEPKLCETLIAGYKQNGGEDSGFMVEREGMTVLKVDHHHKRRADWIVEDRALIQQCHVRIQRRLVPEILRAYQFNASRIERNLVACYSAANSGHFNRHRDNTTKGTAHRRFAVTINLNADDYKGGDLVFPEFGRARFRPPTGGACVFSCSMLHEATAVTKGERYAFLPFLYNDEAAQVRQQNLRFLAGNAAE